MRTARSEYLGRVYENTGLLSLVELVDQGHHSVLDVGCGNGANMCLLAQRGHRVVGITLSEAEAHLVASQGFECHVTDIAEAEPPFPAQSFDALLFSHVLEHLAWPDVVLGRYLELLRPGGAVYVALHNVLHVVHRLMSSRRSELVPFSSHPRPHATSRWAVETAALAPLGPQLPRPRRRFQRYRRLSYGWLTSTAGQDTGSGKRA